MYKIGIFLIFLFSYLSPSLWGVSIEFKNLVEYQIPIEKTSLKKSYYSLHAKYYIEKISKNKHGLLLFNYKKFLLENNYYLKGKLTTKNTQLSFYKAYYFSSKLHLIDVKGVINNKSIVAKEVIFDKYKSYELLKCEIKDGSTLYRRKYFTIYEK